MIELEPLDLDPAVRAAVEDLEEEVEVQAYSDKGANGHLFFGQHKILDRPRAIKFYYWAHGRAHDEPKLLSEIESDHITPIHTARFVDDEWAMFQTPFYSRGDLEQVTRRGILSLHQAIDHTIETLVGVSALHAAGFVHRDLKPGNIFIGDEGRARIGDFGSVKAIPEDADHVEGSGHSVIYRPPEAFESGTYGRAGDLYQCGMVLYQLLGGYLPYDADAWLDRAGRKCWDSTADDYERSKCLAESIARQAARQKLLNLDSLPGTVYGSLKTTIRRATRADPRRRQGSTSQFIRELRKIRASCKDWVWDGDAARVSCEGRDVRILRERNGKYRCESNKGRGWRKLQGTTSGAVEPLARHVDDVL